MACSCITVQERTYRYAIKEEERTRKSNDVWVTAFPIVGLPTITKPFAVTL